MHAKLTKSLQEPYTLAKCIVSKESEVPDVFQFTEMNNEMCIMKVRCVYEEIVPQFNFLFREEMQKTRHFGYISFSFMAKIWAGGDGEGKHFPIL